MLACQLFALLHVSLPGVPDLSTLRHILVRHLSSVQGKGAENTDDSCKALFLSALVAEG